MRRTLTFSILWLVAGCAMSLAIALSVFLFIKPPYWRSQMLLVTRDHAPLFEISPYQATATRLTLAFPIHDLSQSLSSRFIHQDTQTINFTGWPELERPLPWTWPAAVPQVAPAPFIPDELSPGHVIVTLSHGWPLPVLAHTAEYAGTECWRQAPGMPHSPNHRLMRAWNETLPASLKQELGWPTRIHWIGLAINTAIYAPLLALIWSFLQWLRATLRTRQWKRLALLLIALPLLGSVTTVLVAWACAAWIVPRAPFDSMDIGTNATIYTPEGSPAPYSMLSSHRIASAAGVQFSVQWSDPGVAPRLQNASDYPVEHLVPAWCSWLYPPEISCPGLYHFRLIVLCGWPLPAMYHRTQRAVEPTTNTIRHSQLEWGLQLPPLIRAAGGPLPRALPLAVRPGAFAINAAFYALLWMCLFGLMFSFHRARARRRASRGRCVACNHILKSADTCPECGTPTPSAIAPPAASTTPDVRAIAKSPR